MDVNSGLEKNLIKRIDESGFIPFALTAIVTTAETIGYQCLSQKIRVNDHYNLALMGTVVATAIGIYGAYHTYRHIKAKKEEDKMNDRYEILKEVIKKQNREYKILEIDEKKGIYRSTILDSSTGEIKNEKHGFVKFFHASGPLPFLSIHEYAGQIVKNENL